MNSFPKQLPGRQKGMAFLSITLVMLVAMTLMTAIGARVAVNSQRMAANSAHADRAFQVADAGVDTALAYMNYNREYVASTATNGWLHSGSSPKWVPCSSSDTAVPCGDGSVNLYGSDWLAYGPVPNLQQVDADFNNDIYLISDNIDDVPANQPWLTCMQILRTAAVDPDLLVRLNLIYNMLVAHGSPLQANLCFPLHFNTALTPPPPSSSNPTLRAVASARNTADARGGRAQVQQDLQTNSRFIRDPLAPLVVHGTPHLDGSIRIWGNPRPPSHPPYDWSILNLNDVAGLNVSSMLSAYLTANATTLASLLNMTETEALALNWNVTFPLAIWSDQSTAFSNSPANANFMNGARTCMPPFDNVANSSCLTLSYDNIAPGLMMRMPDVQDPVNTANTLANLVDSTAPVSFPNDLLDHLFGVPESQVAEIREDATVLSDCTGLSSKPGGFYWVTGNCAITGTVGSEADPLVLVTEGTVSMAGSSEFWGVMYMRGNSHREIEGSWSGLRPTIFGALMVGQTVHLYKNLNIVYNNDVIRRAGYRAGEFVRLPGGWTDEFSGP